MSRVIASQIKNPSGPVLTLPTTQPLDGQHIKTDGVGTLSFSTPTSSTGLVAPEGLGIIGSISTHSDRQNTYSTPEWTSSGPWTTYTSYQSASDNHAIQALNMALGDGLGASGTSEGFLGDSEQEKSRRLQFSNGVRLGYRRDVFHYDNNTNYTGCSWRLMPVRNTSSSAITVNFYAYLSDYWSAGYEGCCIAGFTPNTSLYSSVTSVTGTNIASTQHTNEQSSLTGSMSIPPNTTVLIMAVSCDTYLTTYRFKDTNYFYNLSTTFTNSNIICDMRMLSALYSGRFNLPYTGALSTGFAPIWTKTAAMFGDR